MGVLIDFGTSCPWQLYTFALIHLLSGLSMYIMDPCRLLSQSSVTCTESELVMARFAALSCVYVGALFAGLTYHSKTSPAKITRLSSIALNGATALLVCVVFTGNSSYGGLEKSWMHEGDMLTMIVLVGILLARVSETDATWAQKNSLTEGLGINCKTMLLLILLFIAAEFVAYNDYVDPTSLLAEGLEMTEFGQWMWYFVAVLMFEDFLALIYAIYFDDDAGHEIVVATIMIMALVECGTVHSVRESLSDWMGLSSKVWTRVGTLIALCMVAIVGGRQSGGARREGYQSVSAK